MGKSHEFNKGYTSFDLSSGMEIEIGKKESVKGLSLHGDEFEVIGLGKFKFKKGDILILEQVKKITLRGATTVDTQQVKFKIKRDGKYLSNKEIAEKKHFDIPQGEAENDALFEFNGEIFILRFLSISNLEDVLEATISKTIKIIEK